MALLLVACDDGASGAFAEPCGACAVVTECVGDDDRPVNPALCEDYDGYRERGNVEWILCDWVTVGADGSRRCRHDERPAAECLPTGYVCTFLDVPDDDGGG